MTVPGRRTARTLAAGVVLLAATACVAVTVNVTFPQEKIEGAATAIEDLVREGPKEAPPPARKEDKRGWLGTPARWLAVLGPAPALAQVPDLKIRTPEVMASIEARRQRFPQLQQWKSDGCIGESARGLLEARPPNPGRQCGPEVARLIADENRDRMTLYRELVKQNNMPPEDIARVQGAFAKVNRQKAAAGEWIQSETGQWGRK
jgi:uncharacterized protein YdbL (DUF1318 family)